MPGFCLLSALHAQSSSPSSREGLTLLHSKNLLEEFLADVEKLGRAGEEQQRVFLKLAAVCTRLTEDPINAVIKGESAARKAGAVVKGLRIKSQDFGRLGRGLQFHSALRRKIHQIAARMGISRRDVVSLTAIEHGYGGARCSLCEESGTTGGLKFVEIARSPKRTDTRRRRRLFDSRDDARSFSNAMPTKAETS